MMFAVDIKDEKITEKLYDELIHRGYIVGNRGSALRIDPPLTISKSEIDAFAEVLSESKSRFT
jgi:acetylornithine aminotransferase